MKMDKQKNFKKLDLNEQNIAIQAQMSLYFMLMKNLIYPPCWVNWTLSQGNG